MLTILSPARVVAARKAAGERPCRLVRRGETTAVGMKLVWDEHPFEWIRAREAAGLGPLIYVNASCNSYYKAIREISAAQSKLLVSLPSISSSQSLALLPLPAMQNLPKQ